MVGVHQLKIIIPVVGLHQVKKPYTCVVGVEQVKKPSTCVVGVHQGKKLKPVWLARGENK